MELTERLKLIESMIAEGRRAQRDGRWTIVLWGVAYYVAIAWSSGMFGGPIWGSTTGVAGDDDCTWLLNAAWSARMRKSARPETTLGRAIISIWTAMGISMFMLLLPLGLAAGLTSRHVAVVMTLARHGQCCFGIILKWKMQIGCAVVGGWRRRPRCLAPVPQGTDCFPGGDFSLPDFVWHVRDDSGVARRVGAGQSMPELPDLNPVIHGKLRLAVLSLLWEWRRRSLRGCARRPDRRMATWARS